MSVKITIELDLPEGKILGQHPLNQKLWRQLQLPPGWRKCAMYMHHNKITLKGRFEAPELVQVDKAFIEEIFAKLLLIRNT